MIFLPQRKFENYKSAFKIQEKIGYKRVHELGEHFASRIPNAMTTVMASS